MSTYSFARIRLISFEGTELKLGRSNRPSAAPGPFVVGVMIGQRGREDEGETVNPLPPAMENTGRQGSEPAVKQGEFVRTRVVPKNNPTRPAQ